jgi:hypothetical protein
MYGETDDPAELLIQIRRLPNGDYTFRVVGSGPIKTAELVATKAASEILMDNMLAILDQIENTDVSQIKKDGLARFQRGDQNPMLSAVLDAMREKIPRGEIPVYFG